MYHKKGGYGTLSTLPREIRYHVYHSLLQGSCLVMWHQGSQLTTANSALLWTSKAISSEFTQVLFSKNTSNPTVFRYELSLKNAIFYTPFNQIMTDRMMNINFDIDLSANAFEDYKKMNPKCDTIIDRFSGTKIRRHEFLIRFALAPTFRRWDLVHKIPLIEKLECLVGFEKLTVLVEVPADFLSGSDDSAVSDSEIRIITSDTEIRVMQRFMHGLLMKYISTLLSPSLGPCVPSSTFSENSKVSETCKLEFQPHKYHFDIIQAQAHRILLEEEIIEDGLLLLQRWTITP